MPDSLSSQFKQIDELLKRASRVLIASHERPDPDAIGSVLALHRVFKQNLESFPYLPDSPSKNLSFLPGFFDIKTEINYFEPDILFCLDYGDFKRLRLPERVLTRKSLPIVTIDHHVASDQRGQVKILKPEISSTAEIIYHWLKYKGIGIDKEIASCLLAGIFSDSGGFCHAATTPETLSIVSELLLKGVSLNKIASQTLLFNKPLHLSRAWGQVLSRTQLDEKTGLTYSWLTCEDIERFGVGLADFDGITNIISAGSSINLGLFLVEHEKGRVKGSLRSEPQGGIDAAKLAKALGGGGHAYAAGFAQEGTIEETLKKVLKLIE
jgi:phosphoesterase RecJ-like protein